MEIKNKDVLEHIKTLQDKSINTTFSDFPYFSGTEWQYIDNILQMKGQGKDFMSGWSIQDANWWREYLAELFRVMKYGGYVVFYSISQQSWAPSALMVEAGFEKCQELHWANISNFPKASDAGKACDKRVGAEREVVGKIKQRANSDKSNSPLNKSANKEFEPITAPATDLSKLFDGYKYGKAPLKKITEPILVFRKPCKFGSVLNDLMACQTDIEISPAVLDIERNRVGLSENDPNLRKNSKNHHHKGDTGFVKGENYKGKGAKAKQDLGYHSVSGRFPATLFISPEAAELLDSQLDVVTFELNGKIYTTKRLEYQRLVSFHVLNNTFESCKVLGVKREVMRARPPINCIGNEYRNKGNVKFSEQKQVSEIQASFGDSGYISRVLHQPDFTEQDFASLEYAMNDLCQYSKGIVEDTFYCPTVSPSERNEGLENYFKVENEVLENTHMTLKPIALNKQVFSLFLLPKEFDQVVYCPFSGTGSEVIGVMQAGVNPENIISVEINPDFCTIQKARISYFAKKLNIEFKQIENTQEKRETLGSQLQLF